MRKILFISLACVLALTVSIPVYADQVDTEAIVGGSGSAPYVCAKFETPDDDPAPDTQILPIPGANKVVKFYVVCGDPNGIPDLSAVYIKVYELDGVTLKFQLDAIKPAWTVIPWGGLVDMDGDCSGDTVVATALDELDAQGRITYGFDPVRQAQMDLDLVKYDLEHGKQILIELIGEMHYHQPAGDYKVEAIVVDQGGKTGTLINFFEYISIVALKIDFTTINWGTVNVAAWNILYGDSQMGTPSKPTVQNIGNDPSKLQLTASDMFGINFVKKISLFDAYMDGGHVEFPSNSPTIITDPTTGDAILLPPCTPTQIDFSIHPPDGTPEDTYVGTMDIEILHY
jgi:hypothetical protein